MVIHLFCVIYVDIWLFILIKYSFAIYRLYIKLGLTSEPLHHTTQCQMQHHLSPQTNSQPVGNTVALLSMGSDSESIFLRGCFFVSGASGLSWIKFWQTCVA